MRARRPYLEVALNNRWVHWVPLPPVGRRASGCSPSCLLHHVRKLMGSQGIHAGRLPGTIVNVLMLGKCLCIQIAAHSHGVKIGVDAHLAEIEPEARLHEAEHVIR